MSENISKIAVWTLVDELSAQEDHSSHSEVIIPEIILCWFQCFVFHGPLVTFVREFGGSD